MSRKLKKNSRDNKDIILDKWKQVAPHYWTHKMLAEELGVSWDALNKTIYRARLAGDPRAVYPLAGKSPW